MATFAINFTEIQLNELVSELKHNVELVKTITEQRGIILEDTKKKECELKVRQDLRKYYCAVNDSFQYMKSLLFNEMTSLRAAYHSNNLSDINKVLAKIKVMHHHELPNVKKCLEDLQKFDEKYLMYDDIYIKYNLLVCDIIYVMHDLCCYFEISCITFPTCLKNLSFCINGHHDIIRKKLIRIAFTARKLCNQLWTVVCQGKKFGLL